MSACEMTDKEIAMRADAECEVEADLCWNCGDELTEDSNSDSGDYCSGECEEEGEFEKAIDRADALMDRMKEDAHE